MAAKAEAIQIPAPTATTAKKKATRQASRTVTKLTLETKEVGQNVARLSRSRKARRENRDLRNLSATTVRRTTRF